MLLSSKILRNVEVQNSTREIEIKTDFVVVPQENPQEKIELKAKAKAEKIVAEALQKKEAILEETLAEKEIAISEGLAQGLEEGLAKGKEQGYKEGYQDGYDKGYRELKARLNELEAEKKTLLGDLQATYNNLYQEAEEKLVLLSLEIAEQVIHRKLAEDKDLFFDVAKAVLQEVHAGETYYLFVNPIDLARANQLRDKLIESLPLGVSLQIIGTSEVTKGSCKVENENGFSEGSIEGQLEKIKEILLGELKYAN